MNYVVSHLLKVVSVQVITLTVVSFEVLKKLRVLKKSDFVIQ